MDCGGLQHSFWVDDGYYDIIFGWMPVKYGSVLIDGGELQHSIRMDSGEKLWLSIWMDNI